MYKDQYQVSFTTSLFLSYGYLLWSVVSLLLGTSTGNLKQGFFFFDSVAIAISHYQRCLDHVTNVPQLYTSTVTGNDARPLLEPANPCDATIGNEFPESNASLEITGLKCCILTQNQKGRIIRVPTVGAVASKIYFTIS